MTGRLEACRAHGSFKGILWILAAVLAAILHGVGPLSSKCVNDG